MVVKITNTRLFENTWLLNVTEDLIKIRIRKIKGGVIPDFFNVELIYKDSEFTIFSSNDLKKSSSALDCIYDAIHQKEREFELLKRKQD